MIAPALVWKLLNTPAVATLVTDRISPALNREQYKGETLIVYEIDDSEQIARTYESAGNLSSVSVKINAIAATYEAAAQLAAAVKTAIDDDAGSWNGVNVQGAFFETENDDELPITEDGKSVVIVIQQMYTVVIST